MTERHLESWEGFLPERAIVMARPSTAAVSVPSPLRSIRVLFVGQQLSIGGHDEASQLLVKMIEAMGLPADAFEVHPDTPGELAPEVVVRFGAERSGWRQAAEAPPELMTFHPGRLLSEPALKRDVWEDLKQVASRIGHEIPARGPARRG